MTNIAPGDALDAALPSGGSFDAAEVALLGIESWPHPVVFVEAESLRVFWTNSAGKVALRSAWLTHPGGRIVLTQRSQQVDFDQFLRRAESEAVSWVLNLADGQGALIFRCRSIAGAPYKIVSIFNPENPSTALPDVGALLGLTPSESRITQGLMDGHRADELAQDQGISLETVRTHIRRIYLKTGANSREQLIAKISAFRVP